MADIRESMEGKKVEKVKKEEFNLKMKSKNKSSGANDVKSIKTKAEIELKVRSIEKAKPCSKEGKAKKEGKESEQETENRESEKKDEDKCDKAEEIGKPEPVGESAIHMGKDDWAKKEKKRSLAGKDKEKNIAKLKEKLEKINAKIEALMEKKVGIMIQIKEVESKTEKKTEKPVKLSRD